MYQSGDRKKGQVSTNHDAKNRKVPVGVEETPRMKQAAQLQAMADDFVDAKAVVQRRRVTVVYGNESVVGYNTENLTLSQLQNLLNSPYLTQQNRGDIQAAIWNGEYLGAPVIEEDMDFEQDVPQQNQQTRTPQFLQPLPKPQQNQQTSTPQFLQPLPKPQQNQQSPFLQPLPKTQQNQQSPFLQPLPKPQQNQQSPFLQPLPKPQQNQKKEQSQFLQPLPKPQQNQQMGQSSKMGRQSSVFSSPLVKQSPVEREQIVILYRGLHSVDQGKQILQSMSAGGEKANPDCGKPSEESVRKQVGMDDVMPNARIMTPYKESDVTEYTSTLSVAQNASKGNGVLMIKINSKYLSRGDSGLMNGWIALKSAPLISAELIK